MNQTPESGQSHHHGKQDEHYSNCIATTFDIISYMGV